MVPHVLVTKYHLVPIGLNGSSLTLAMADPSNLVAVDEVKFLTGYDVKVAVATVSSIQQVIDRFYDRAMKYDQVLNDLLSLMACHAAVKAGDRLTVDEIAALVAQRHLVHDPHHCPHGRPTSLLLSRQELDRQFRRT